MKKGRQPNYSQHSKMRCSKRLARELENLMPALRRIEALCRDPHTPMSGVELIDNADKLSRVREILRETINNSINT